MRVANDRENCVQIREEAKLKWIAHEIVAVDVCGVGKAHALRLAKPQKLQRIVDHARVMRRLRAKRKDPGQAKERNQRKRYAGNDSVEPARDPKVADQPNQQKQRGEHRQRYERVNRHQIDPKRTEILLLPNLRGKKQTRRKQRQRHEHNRNARQQGK